MSTQLISQVLLHENYIRVHEKIRFACQKSGRDPSEINLIWVSKTRPLSDLILACNEGAQLFGENKVQEALEKFPLTDKPQAKLHFIGRLQSNKIRKILPLCSAIHSVDSVKLLQKLDITCGEMNLKMDVFLQINTSGESSKAGFSEEEFFSSMPEWGAISNLNIIGLMTIGPNSPDLTLAAKSFQQLKKILTQILQNPDNYPICLKNLKFLSMGMSHDFTVAIQEGSHYIRVGTDLFGTREE